MTPPERLLVTIDFSPLSTTLATLAARLAAEWGSEVHWAHVWWSGLAPQSSAHREVAGKVAAELEEQLAELAADLPGPEVHRHLVESGSVPSAIRDLARDLDADLVIAGAHGHGIRPLLLGSVSQSLAKSLPTDFLCVRQTAAGPPRPPQRLLLPIDFSKASERAVERAVELVGQTGTLRLVHVLEDVGRPAYPDLFGLQTGDAEHWKIAAAVRERLGALERELADRVGEVSQAVLEGRTAAEITRHAEEWGADWIVVSSHGRHGLEAFFAGSVTQAILQRSSLPVLVVPGTERR